MQSSLLSTLLFPAPPTSYTMRSFPNELLWIPWDLDYEARGVRDSVPAVFLHCPNARYLVLYLHSNGEDIGLCYTFGCGLRMVLEVHVLLVEYPGYGICPGCASEDSICHAADAAFRFATEVLRCPKEDVIIMGRSLGAAVATCLARRVPCHGLILVAPFLSLVEAVGAYVGSLSRMLVSDIFNTAEHMQHVKAPLLVIHGKKDRLVPCSQGGRLIDLCSHDRHLLVCPEDMSHNCDLLSNPEFLVRPMLRFFSLPDYNFDELTVPAEAFDKRLCPQYHNLVEMTRGDAPLAQPMGDQIALRPGDGMDDADLEDIVSDHTVHSMGMHWPGLGIVAIAGGAAPGSPPHVEMAEDADLAGAERAPGRLGGAGVGAPGHSDPSENSVSTTVPSSARLSESTDGPTGASSMLPGLQILDIDVGISRFLREASGSLRFPL
mmetsp:Transcript_96859/g.215957  ORF Transcript_96859/g.215957 Transcript_96859/m.215957 type:complete len:435 (+) Transcript_96859:135-1439(+)